MTFDEVVDEVAAAYAQHVEENKHREYIFIPLSSDTPKMCAETVAANFKKQFQKGGVEAVHRYTVEVMQVPAKWALFTPELYERVREAAAKNGIDMPVLGVPIRRAIGSGQDREL